MVKEKFISIAEAIKKGKGRVAIRGWVYRERSSKEFKFIILRDSSDIIQCVLKREEFENDWKDIDKLQIESSLEIIGQIKKDKRAPNGYEVHVNKINIVGLSDQFPINKDLNEDLLGDRRHLWLRSRKMNAIMKIRSSVIGAIHNYFRGKGFYEFQSPIIIPGGAEEGPTLFEVNYFGRKMYLSQTWQLYAEAAMYSLEKIYCVAPSFRAEKSKTKRHLTEFWHTEMEVAWASLDDLMDYAEEMVKYIIKKVIKEHKKEFEILNRDFRKLEPSLKKKFPRITYDDVLKILNEKKNIYIPWGKDLRTIEEERFMEDYDTPVFVTHYPKEIMAFYKPRDPRNPKVALCFDMLGPENNHEIIGGSVRDTNIDELKKSLKEKGEKVEDYFYYLDIHSYGPIPHGGFGLGTERLIKWICGLDDIKDAIAFPRTMERWRP
ncbi:MAG: asparagine--tRNA ligase [Candidatus Pacearchaeota archaeon]